MAYSIPFLNFDKSRFYRDLKLENYFDIIFGIVIRISTNGNLAVYIFFVLSGFVLSLQGRQSGIKFFSLLLTARYLRLLIPVFVTSGIAFFLLSGEMFFNHQIDPASGAFLWINSFYNFKPTIYNFLKFNFFDLFLSYDSKLSYNAVTWTIGYELIGSYLIYLFIELNRFKKNGKLFALTLVSACLTLINYIYLCFFIGVILAELKNQIENLTKSKISNFITTLLFIITLLLSSYYRFDEFLNCIFACLIVFFTLGSSVIQLIFSSRISQFLGKISFMLYLIQIPLICSFTCFSILETYTVSDDREYLNILILILTLFLGILIAYILTPIDKYAIFLSAHLKKYRWTK